MTVAGRIADLKERLATGVTSRSSLSRSLPVLVGIGPCAHLLPDTGTTLPCPSCTGTVTLKVLGCEVYGTCTVGKLVAGTACCKGCTSYLPPPSVATTARHVPVAPPAPLPPPKGGYGPVGKRHLVYHVLPVSGNGVWRKCVRNLTLRWGLFTGRKIVSVATGGTVTERVDRVEKVSGRVRTLSVDTVDVVRAALPPDAEVFEVPNDPVTWERASWGGLWSRVLEGADDTDAVLYAHAKGVTRKLTSTCHFWSDLLYTLALDHWNTTEKLLRRHPIVGSLLKSGVYFPPPLHTSQFHYHGNVWWARAGVLRDRLPLRPLEPHGWASEAWVGSAFHRFEAGVLFNPSTQINYLYSPQEADRVAAAYDMWARSQYRVHGRGDQATNASGDAVRGGPLEG